MRDIGSIIKKNRIKKGMTQQDLASKLFVTKQAVSKWENNKGLPDISLMQTLSEYFDVSIDTLLGNSNLKSNRRFHRFLFPISLVFIGVMLFTFAINLNKSLAIKNFVEDIEAKVRIDLPKGNYIKIIDFSDWGAYGNTISISKMSYVIFSENGTLDAFEKAIIDNNIWMSEINTDLVSNIPREIQNFIKEGDYILIYNIDLGLYDGALSNSVQYHYILLVYQINQNRLIVFEYMK
ncbi:MAG: helix-turn-helix transcriptional regulator [Tissierellales bacterium]|nr:helix-turn-helix transcriptional regulator [Tissierellales bacterium]